MGTLPGEPWVAAHLRLRPGQDAAIAHDDRFVSLKRPGTTASGEPLTAGTPFQLAPISESFAALAVMQLVEEGRAELGRPVQRHVSGFRPADPGTASRTAVRHLRPHTRDLSRLSGRRDPFSRDNGAEALAGFVRELERLQPSAAMGLRFRWSRSNSTVLARLFEVASGVPFEQHVQEQVLPPFGMRSTVLPVSAGRTNRWIHGHG